MHLRKAIKTIAAVGTGAIMMGATVLGAMAAADLNQYPNPLFIKDGVFDGLLVVGDDAKGEDIIGITSIALTLQQQSVIKKTVDTSTTTTVSVEGDAVKVDESTNKWEFNEALNTITTSVTSSDLGALEDGSISNEFGTFKYTQTIDLPPALLLFTTDPNDDTDTPKDYLTLNGSKAYNYKVSFTPALKSDHKTASTGYLEDIKNKKITLLGQTYTILKADHTGIGQIELTLMAGAVTDIMEEGETKTYNLEGEDYEVTLDYVSSTEAKFTVNTEVTDSMQETDTYRLNSGTEIGVTDIMENEAGEAAGGDKVEFSLGANKIKLADTFTNNSNSTGLGCAVTIGSEDSSNVDCEIVTSSDGGLTNGNDVFISSFEIFYKPSETIYVGVGDSASDKAEEAEDESGVFFLNAFDYKYEGLYKKSPETISVKPSGNENYKLKFTSKAGVEYNEYVMALNGTGRFLGKLSGSTIRDFVIDETTEITDEEYFAVSKNKYSRILQFKDVAPGTSTTDNSGTLKVKDLGSGSTIEVTYANTQGDLVLDGNTFKLNVTSDASSANLRVDMNGDGDAADAFTQFSLWTNNGANITLAAGSSTPGANQSFMCVETEQDEDNNVGRACLEFTNSSGKLDINDVRVNVSSLTGGTTFTDGRSVGGKRVGTSYVYQDYLYDDSATVPTTSAKSYGTFVEWDKKGTGSEQDDVTIEYYDDQAYGLFYVTSGATTSSSTTGGDGTVTTEEVSEIDVGAVKMAAEAGAVTANNMILVGGPCANTIVRSLMGKTEANCFQGFDAGKATIQLFEQTNGKVAVVVAGGEATDTRRASLVLANYKDYAEDLMGDEVVVTTVTSTPTVAQPVVATTTTVAATTTTVAAATTTTV